MSQAPVPSPVGQVGSPAAVATGAGCPWIVCVRCAARQPDGAYQTACARCGGLLDAVYEAAPDAAGPPGLDPLRRFADLLPFPPSAVPPGHGISATPLVELEADDAVPVDAYGKWEGARPTGSAKDPMAVVALAYMRECGVSEFVFSSTGNSTAAFARALALWPGLTAHVCAPAGFPRPASPPPNLVTHDVPGDYAAAHHSVAALCRGGAVTEGGFFSVGRREGLKLAYLEAMLDAPRPPTVVVQAVSSGMGIVAAAKAVTELAAMGRLRERPRLVAAQQASCAPMAASFEAGSVTLRPGDIVCSPRGRAIATLLGDPSASYPYVREAVIRSGGVITEVADGDIVAACRSLRRRGLDVCHSSATAYAAVAGLRRSGWITDNDVVLVNLTGSARSAAGRQESRALTGLPAGPRPGERR